VNLGDRLRDVLRSGRGSPSHASGSEAHQSTISSHARSRPPSARHDVAELLGGEWCEDRDHSFLIVDRAYQQGYRLGGVAVADCLPDADGRWRRLDLLMTGTPAEGTAGPLLFFDLETTGLAGGAGTYAFLVGCGWFDGTVFRVRQFVLTSFAAERALLEALANLLRRSAVLVTYNGKTFDAPLIDTRFLFHRLPGPCGGMAHVDLLHPARRLWRPAVASFEAADGSCRLSWLERSVLGHVREDDVPGHEIPSRYFHFVRSGDPAGLHGVLEHNRFDLLALAMLTARAGQLLDEGASGARTAREALGLGRLFERGGLTTEARACYSRAIELESDLETHVEALRACALLSRRQRRYADAAEAWRKLLATRGCPSRVAQEATEALAVHHEHRLRDLPSARQFAVRSLGFNITRSRVQAVHHRLARIDRKLGTASLQAIPLF
jgi:uncharacterized protein YprB with RNaseH-like and TPR domain